MENVELRVLWSKLDRLSKHIAAADAKKKRNVPRKIENTNNNKAELLALEIVELLGIDYKKLPYAKWDRLCVLLGADVLPKNV